MLAKHHFEEYGNVNIKTLIGHEDDVLCCAFSSDWNLLATGAHDFTLRLWNVDGEVQLFVLNGHTSPVKCVCFNFQNDQLASGGNDAMVIVWDVTTGYCLHRLHGHTLCVESVSFSRSGNFLCSASWDNTSVLWQLEHGTQLLTLDDHKSVVSCCCFSVAGNMLATGSWDYVIHVYNISEYVDFTDESKDGSSRPSSRLAVTPLPRDSESMNRKSENKCTDSRTLTGHTSNIKTIVFSNDDLLASASWDCTLRIWNPLNGACLHVLRGHEGFVHTCAFSLDSLYLASTGDDDKIKVWSVKTGEMLKTLEALTDEIQHLAFTKSGSLLASGPEHVSLCLYYDKT